MSTLLRVWRPVCTVAPTALHPSPAFVLQTGALHAHGHSPSLCILATFKLRVDRPHTRTGVRCVAQSHVVHGHVGNKSAVFPLQLLGIEVDAVDTVQFSNHTGYASFAGKVLDAEGLWALIEGLDKNDLLEYTHLLTGYMGSAALCR